MSLGLIGYAGLDGSGVEEGVIDGVVEAMAVTSPRLVMPALE